MLSAGTIVGDKYRLEEPIGQGGMATVWRAVHTTLDRPVAVKFLEAVGTGADKLAERSMDEIIRVHIEDELGGRIGART